MPRPEAARLFHVHDDTMVRWAKNGMVLAGAHEPIRQEKRGGRVWTYIPPGSKFPGDPAEKPALPLEAAQLPEGSAFSQGWNLALQEHIELISEVKALRRYSAFLERLVPSSQRQAVG